MIIYHQFSMIQTIIIIIIYLIIVMVKFFNEILIQSYCFYVIVLDIFIQLKEDLNDYLNFF